MTQFSFSNTYQAAEKQYNLGKGEYFKPQEGDNKIRLVSECLPHESMYQGKKQFKFLCQVIDLKDGKVKPYFMPVSVFKAIENLQMSDEYSFSEVPMPYDINIRAVGAGTIDVKYSVIAARQNRELSADETRKIEEAPSVRELQAKVYEAAAEKGEVVDARPMKEEGDPDHINVDEIPF
jgi:hypothetical protein